MKAITLWQPWASLIAFGHKTNETRSWGTAYRGLLLIHAAKQQPCDAIGLTHCFNRFLRDHGCKSIPSDLPVGSVVAIAHLADCIKVDSDMQFPPFEYEFGNLEAGRFAWRLENVRALSSPVKASGRQGLWTPDPQLIATTAKVAERGSA